MAFSITKHNRGTNKYTYTLDEKAEYKKLAELELGKTYIIHGLFINKKSQYGDHPVAVGDRYYYDLPKHALEQVKEVMQDDEATEAINAGHVGIVTGTYHDNGRNKDFVGFDFVDIP